MIICNTLGSQLIVCAQNMELTTCNQNITTKESTRATKRHLISVPYLSLSNASGRGYSKGCLPSKRKLNLLIFKEFRDPGNLENSFTSHSFIYPTIHPFNKCFLNFNLVPGTVLDAKEDTAKEKNVPVRGMGWGGEKNAKCY